MLPNRQQQIPRRSETPEWPDNIMGLYVKGHLLDANVLPVCHQSVGHDLVSCAARAAGSVMDMAGECLLGGFVACSLPARVAAPGAAKRAYAVTA